jgi:hypothetical protein
MGAGKQSQQPLEQPQQPQCSADAKHDVTNVCVCATQRRWPRRSWSISTRRTPAVLLPTRELARGRHALSRLRGSLLARGKWRKEKRNRHGAETNGSRTDIQPVVGAEMVEHPAAEHRPEPHAEA